MQKERLSSWVGACRYVFNLAKETKEYAYKAYGISLSYNDLQNQLPQLKTEAWIKDVPGQTLQNAVKRMDLAYQSFFRGAGYPKWAKKDHYNSITFPQNVKVIGNRVKLPKLGGVRFFNSRPIAGKIKTATVSRTVSGWYISITCEVDRAANRQEPLPESDQRIGVDMGLSHLAITSEGELIENPRHTKKYERQLRVAQRSLSRKVRGSNNRAKQKRTVARLHEKIRNTRKDCHHKVSSRLVSENQAIVVEDLAVSNMVKNRRLSKAISDAGWSQFTTILEYKCNWYGREFVRVPPAYSSRDCSSCGHRTEKMPLNIRFWTCPQCSAEHQRDVNAAKNLLGRAGLVSANVEGLPSCVGQESARALAR